MGIFGAAHEWDAKRSPMAKICHTYPALMELGTVMPYLQNIQKVYESRDTPLNVYQYQLFLSEISKFFYFKKYRYRLHCDI